jgi:hypothetical protein
MIHRPFGVPIYLCFLFVDRIYDGANPNFSTNRSAIHQVLFFNLASETALKSLTDAHVTPGESAAAYHEQANG